MIDLIAPNRHNPEGIHSAVWDDISGFVRPEPEAFRLPKDKLLTLVSYMAREMPEAFVELVGTRDELADMPLFLSGDGYVTVPLEATYQAAFHRIAEYCRQVVEGASAES